MEHIGEMEYLFNNFFPGISFQRKEHINYNNLILHYPDVLQYCLKIAEILLPLEMLLKSI